MPLDPEPDTQLWGPVQCAVLEPRPRRLLAFLRSGSTITPGSVCDIIVVYAVLHSIATTRIELHPATQVGDFEDDPPIYPVVVQDGRAFRGVIFHNQFFN